MFLSGTGPESQRLSDTPPQLILTEYPPAKTIQSTLFKTDTQEGTLTRAWDPFGDCVTAFIKGASLIKS